MKRKLTLLLLLLTLGLAVGCGGDNKSSSDPKPPQTPNTPNKPNPSLPEVPSAADIMVDLDGEDHDLGFSGSAKERTMSFIAPEDWTATITEPAAASRVAAWDNKNIRAAADTSWVTLDKTSGSKGDIKITITAKANEGADRTVDIIVKSGEKEIKITITQVNATQAADLIRLGNLSLKAERYDQAVSFYEEAYGAEDGGDSNAKAVVYSALGKIAKISTEPRVVNLLRKRLGFTSYPNRLNALISEDWLREYPKRIDYGYQDETSGKYVYWLDENDVKNPSYPEIDKAGYYYRDNEFTTTHTFGSAEKRYARAYSYSDANGDYIRWYDQWYVDDPDYMGIDKVGYYKDNSYYDEASDEYIGSYTFISDEPKYDIESYINDSTYGYISWYDGWYINNPSYPGITKAGYYRRVSSQYVLVSDVPQYRIESGYADDEGYYVQWYDQGSVNNQNYPDITQVGYYRDIYHGYHFVSDEARYESSTSLPGLLVPDWLKGEKDSWYNESLLGGASKVASMDTWAMLLFANVLNNTDGDMNKVIDETIAAVFGDSFEAALDRVSKMDKTATLQLDKEFIDELNLSEYITVDDHIGWAEINGITSAMVAMKAGLEWVAAYDLNMDLGFMKYAWKHDPADFIEHLKKDLTPANLPINSHFMEARPGKMAKAKADFITAIQGLQASYDAIVENPIYPPEVNNQTVREGIGKVVDAIKNGGKVWIPEDPTKGDWPTAGGDKVLVGVDMGKFFQEEYFAPKYIFALENGKPVFVAGGVKLTPENYATEIDKAKGVMGIKFNKTMIKDLVFDCPKLYEKVPELNNNTDLVLDFITDDFISARIDRSALSRLIFEKYYGLSN